MSRHVMILVLYVAAVGAGFLLRALDGPFVVVAGILGVAGVAGMIVESYREAKRGRQKPPWSPTDGDEA